MGIICPPFRRGCHQKSPSQEYILTNLCWNEFSQGHACPSANGIFYPKPLRDPFGHIPHTIGDIFSHPLPPLSLDFSPCSAVLRNSLSSWAAVVHYWSALIPKALRSYRRHPVHSFSCPPTKPAPPPSHTSAVSCPPCAPQIDPANRIRLLCMLASMPSV